MMRSDQTGSPWGPTMVALAAAEVLGSMLCQFHRVQLENDWNAHMLAIRCHPVAALPDLRPISWAATCAAALGVLAGGALVLKVAVCGIQVRAAWVPRAILLVIVGAVMFAASLASVLDIPSHLIAGFGTDGTGLPCGDG
ncbi:hypothetical protein [Gordonia sp. N1V]|uniref:hypothetical protein n=1 Tax=Gordonia sp. N1V TaxID=3034163 RepID=UPI0023E2AE40|nr:hypothetical protein [Gordonia sp. N1V]MDF3282238.1 hypothetical protein [Gordonia sp. N1V]